MKSLVIALAIGWSFLGTAAGGELRHSDVVFMYQAGRSTYREYGATVLAWGGLPTNNAREEAVGVKWFGSVGMVTEFNAYHKRFPDTYAEGLCRDLDGNPVKVPWLTDHNSQGIPYWWCCTQQPLFRQFLQERVAETLKAGADGLHVDDHLGTSGGLWLGLCFCDRCVRGFSDALAKLPGDERAALPAAAREPGFDFREEARRWVAGVPGKRKIQDHPLWPVWTAYQHRAAAAFMLELRGLAERTAGRPVPVGANAGLLWPRHLSDYKAVDLFSAETDHHAESRRVSDSPLVAYRMAEAMDRPYAATASGQDWAFIKERNLPGLVRAWIAVSYAAGQRLMAPHHQWCYTAEKGTHWYDGPSDRFVPLYQYVKRQAAWFDGFGTYADLTVVLPHRAYVKDTARWVTLCNQLASNNIAYSIEVGGDELVDHPLVRRSLEKSRHLLIPERAALQTADQTILDQVRASRPHSSTVEEALRSVKPAVRVQSPGVVRVLPRVKAGVAVIHLVNYGYDSVRDAFVDMQGVRVTLDLAALGIEGASACQWIPLEGEGKELPMTSGVVEVPSLGLWGMLVVRGR
jgi:hypothetical protein